MPKMANRSHQPGRMQSKSAMQNVGGEQRSKLVEVVAIYTPYRTEYKGEKGTEGKREARKNGGERRQSRETKKKFPRANTGLGMVQMIGCQALTRREPWKWIIRLNKSKSPVCLGEPTKVKGGMKEVNFKYDCSNHRRLKKEQRSVIS